MLTQRVIFIDAASGAFLETKVYSLEDMQSLVGGLIECACRLPNGDEIYVNEEGLFNGYLRGFTVDGNDTEPFVGNGFVIGSPDELGEHTDAESTIRYVMDRVRFFQLRKPSAGEQRA